MRFDEFESHAKKAIAIFRIIREFADRDWHGPSLTDSDRQQIVQLQEEAGEAIGAISHIIERFGKPTRVRASGHEADIFREALQVRGAWNAGVLEEACAELQLLVGRLRAMGLKTLPDYQISQQLDDQSSAPRISILFLAADPTDTSRLRLGEEFREISEQIALSSQRERFELAMPHLSLRARDITRAMLNAKPRIVHFSGHGTPEGSICFENESGESHPIDPEALSALFEQFAEQVECVVLNACYATNQAMAIARHIDYVIGMSKAISDKAAISFSLGFYVALAAGKTIEEAFEFGRIQIMLQGFPEHLVPALLKKGQTQS
jgi:hypothetical protein